jgi:tRNA (guanine37-N1)-methyltransferase
MRFDVITVFPEMIQGALKEGVVAQAIKQDLLQVHALTPRGFTYDAHKTVDDRPFGGGDGMVMLAEPLKQTFLSIAAVIEDIPREQRRVVLLSPRGPRLTDAKVRDLAKYRQLTLVCGRYSGVDERFVSLYVDEEISIGDYVLSGGELPALVVIDSIARHLPGVLGNSASACEESFAENLLEYPQFTRPREFEGLPIPPVLLGGHHSQITYWRRLLSILTTAERRPDLLMKASVTEKELEEAHDLFESMDESARRACGLRDASLIAVALAGRRGK